VFVDSESKMGSAVSAGIIFPSFAKVATEIAAECVSANPATVAARAKPKIAQRNILASGQTVQKWFSDALKINDVKPSLTACKKFAREFQIIVNRQNNAELESHGSVLLELGDVSPEEYLNRKVQKVVSAADQVLVAARDLEAAFAGNYHWTDRSGKVVSLEEIVTMLHRIGAVPRVSGLRAKMGRPPERWHETARRIVPLIKAVLRDAGYRGSLNMRNENSAVVQTGTAAINWAYKIDVEAVAFAFAMRRRDRKKRDKTASDFDSRFPDAMRIKVL
jgi:hypothetical protein